MRAIGTHIVAVMVGAALLVTVQWLRPTCAVVTPGELQPGEEPLDPATAAPEEFAWSEQPPAMFPVPPYASELRSVRIVLDPGHGGRADRAHWKRGPTGLREAEVNLRVAQFLREFLEAVGAEVVLTREGDKYLHADVTTDNHLRIQMANELRADLFVAIHHNGSEKPQPNYTSVFCHGEPNESPASRCAARYLLTGLNDALRLEQHLPCALLSDQRLYDDGLLVLREARVPAVLVEGSFHSNPQEEQRLRDPVYNRREAYGYFMGLARWAQAGLPRISVGGAGERRSAARQDACGPRWMTD